MPSVLWKPRLWQLERDLGEEELKTGNPPTKPPRLVVRKTNQVMPSSAGVTPSNLLGFPRDIPDEIRRQYQNVLSPEELKLFPNRLDWQPTFRKEEIPLSRMPFSQQLEPLGEVTPFRQVREALETPEAETIMDVLGVIGAVFTLAYGGYYGIRSLIPITKEVSDKAFRTVLNTGLDKWIAERSRGVPPAKLKQVQDLLYNIIAKDKIWLQNRATENMLRRMGRTPNTSEAMKQAVDDTIRDVERKISALVTRGTQTGAMAQGGKAFGGKLPGKPPIVPPAPEVTIPKTLEDNLLPVLRGEVPVETLEEQIRKVYTPEKADVIREALTSRLSGLYDQVQAREGKLPSKTKLPISKLITREQFGEVVDKLNIFFRTLRKVEESLSQEAGMPEAGIQQLVSQPLPDVVPSPQQTVTPTTGVATPVGKEPPELPPLWMSKGQPQLTTGVTPTPVVSTPIPGGVAFLPPDPNPATYAQKIQYHAILKEKGMGGASKRRFAQTYIGKKSIADMTEAEATFLIETLQRMPRGSWQVRGGKRIFVPPSLPKTKAIVPENFFNLTYEQPTPARLLTSQTYYAKKLGVGELVRPSEMAKQRFDLEAGALMGAVKQKGLEIEKLARTGVGEKFRSFIRNEPTAAVQDMNELLNKYEEPPDFLSDKERELFTWFRNLNKTIIKGENEIRELLGMDLIPYRQSYVRRVAAEGIALEILNGIYPLPESLKYWSQKIVGAKVFNPSEFKRLSDDLEAYFSKDLIYATNAMVWNGLKEIHLSQPLKAFNEQLTALSKDLPIYDKLSSDELKRIGQVMPASTKKWVEDYARIVIKGQPTDLDMQINQLFLNKGIAGVINTFLEPFGRTLGRQPITNIARVLSRTIMAGVLGPVRPKLIIRNKVQLMLNLAFYTIESNIKGFFPAPPWMNEIIENSLYYKGYTGLEDIPQEGLGEIEKKWHKTYRWSAISNVHQAMKVSGWDTYDLITNPKYSDYPWHDPQRTYKEPRGFLYPSEGGKILREMETGAGATQFGYIAMEMPEIFRHKTLSPVTRLQSWWMNYFFRFHQEAFHRAFKGETTDGLKLPWSRRLAYLKYLVVGGATLTALGYKRSFLLGVLPTYLSPVAQVTLGLYKYVAADNDTERKAGLRQIQYSFGAFIPGSLAWKDFYDVFTGKKPLESLFFYMDTQTQGGTTPTTPSNKGKLTIP